MVFSTELLLEARPTVKLWLTDAAVIGTPCPVRGHLLNASSRSQQVVRVGVPNASPKRQFRVVSERDLEDYRDAEDTMEHLRRRKPLDL